MKKKPLRIVFGIVGLGVFCLTLNYLMGEIKQRQKIIAVSEIVGSKPDLASIHQAIVESFEPGMTQDEVYKSIFDIDPSLEKVVGTEFFQCNDFECSEQLHFFSADFSYRFGVGFVYSLDLKLKKVSLLSW